MPALRASCVLFDLRALPVRLRVGLDVVGRAGLRSGQQSRRRDLLGPELRLERPDDPLRHVRVLAQERRRVLPALSEALVVEAEVRAGLLHDLPLEPGLEDRALPRDARAVDDVE